MAILKARPKISLRVPSEIHPGDRLAAVVLLDCRRAVDVERVNVHLEGTESWTSGSNHGTTRQRTLVSLGARVCELRTLPKGRTELPIQIDLPEDVPPSFRGTAATVAYRVSVEAPIAWWPDAHAGFEIKVRPHDVASPETTSAVYSSNPNGPHDVEPHVELSLASTWTRAGDVVSGAFALANVEHNAYTEVVVGLVATEALSQGVVGWGRATYARYVVHIGVEQAREGAMIPFRLRLPENVAPEYRGSGGPNDRTLRTSLEWAFELAVKIRWKSDLVVSTPFRVLPASPRPGDAPKRLAPPDIGSDRLRTLWQSVGEPLHLTYGAESLEGRFGETALIVRRDHEGRRGVQLVAEVTYPELGLALVVEPASGVRKVVGGGVRVGKTEWDREHFVVARDAEQARAVLRSLLPKIGSARLHHLDDRGLQVAVRGAGRSRNRLATFALVAVHLAEAMETLRTNLPPPTGMAGVLEGWRGLARRLGASLETARMRIASEDRGVDVRLSFDDEGRPLNTWLSVQTGAPLEASELFRWRAEEGMDAITARTSRAVRDVATALAEGARELTVESERITLCLPAPLGLAAGDGHVVTIDDAGRSLERMHRLASVLRGDRGPYR